MIFMSGKKVFQKILDKFFGQMYYFYKVIRKRSHVRRKNCKATLYLCTPLEMLKPGYNPFKRKGITAHTGHAFVGLTDETGKETLWSFSFSEAKNPLQKITGCPGKLTQDYPKFAEYNEAVVYPITREQFDAANKKVDEIKNKK